MIFLLCILDILIIILCIINIIKGNKIAKIFMTIFLIVLILANIVLGIVFYEKIITAKELGNQLEYNIKHGLD